MTAAEQFGISLKEAESAWRRAAADTDAALAAGEPAPSLVDEIRHGLVVSSLLSMAENVPAHLVERLVAAGLWSAPRGVAHADRLSSPEGRAGLLNRLLPHLDPAERPAVAARILDGLAGSVGSYRADQYTAMAAHLAPDELDRVIAAARTVDPPDHRARALAGVAPCLPEPRRAEVVAEAFASALLARYPSQRADALAAVAPHLSPAQLASARAAAGAVEEGEHRVSALAGVAAYLPEPDRTAVLSGALATADALGDAGARARALSSLGPFALDEALDAATATASATALDRLVPHLREDQVEVAFAATLALDWTDRAFVLRRLAPRLSPGQLDRALAAAGDITSPRSRFDLYCTLAPSLPPQRVARLLEAAGELRGDHDRRDAWSGLAPYAPEPAGRDALTRALAVTTAIHSRIHHAHAVAALAPYLPEERRSAAVRRLLGGDASGDRFRAAAAATLAAAFAEPGTWADALVALIPHLPPDLRAGTAADALREGRHRPDVMIRLLPHLAADLRPAAVGKALARALHAAQEEYGSAESLLLLAPHLTAGQLRSTVDAAAAIRTERVRTEVLAGLAPHLPGELLLATAATAGRVRSASLRANALTALAPHLPAGARAAALEQALAAARGDRSEVDLLAGIAAHLPPGQRPAVAARATELALALAAPDSRAKALAKAVRHLPPDQREATIAAVLSEDGPRPPSVLLAALAPYLPAELQRQAVAAVAAIRHPETRAQRFVELVRRLPDELLPDAAAAAGADPSRFWRAELLARLADRLTPELLAAALPAVGRGHFPARAFAERAQALVDADPSPERVRLAVEVLRRALPEHRTYGSLAAVGALAGTIVRVGGPGAAQGVLDAIDEVQARWP
ncbi:hypothetical protein [Dactylosporangium sp. NPDC050588]|uniref:hypothetical protein n=1 Tax=Dactylosporangium sp. NPDC050588 TaxID=3157211 RepID=UPI0034071811